MFGVFFDLVLLPLRLSTCDATARQVRPALHSSTSSMCLHYGAEAARGREAGVLLVAAGAECTEMH